MTFIVAGCYDGSLHGWNTYQNYESALNKSCDIDDYDTERNSKLSACLQLSFAYKTHQSCIKCLALSSIRKYKCDNDDNESRRFLASGGTDEIIRIYDLEKLIEVGELVEHSDTVLALQFVRSEFLLSGGKDGKLCLWRCRDWNCVASLKGHKPGPVTSLAVHPSGVIALSTSTDNSLRMWNLETARPASRNKLSEYSLLELVTWSPSGDGYALVADSQSVLIFRAADNSGKPVRKLKLKASINALCFINGQLPMLVVGLDSGIVRCYHYSALNGLNIDDTVEFQCGARVRSVSQYVGSEYDNCVVVALSTGALMFWDTNEKLQIRVPLQVGSSAHITCMVAGTESLIKNKTASRIVDNDAKTKEVSRKSTEKRKKNCVKQIGNFELKAKDPGGKFQKSKPEDNKNLHLTKRSSNTRKKQRSN